ncbi:MAG: alpha/beta hydrolase [Pseudomonadota bacterium]
MQAQFHAADVTARSDTLLIMLPGAMQRPDDFVTAGFVRAMRSRALLLDLQLASFDDGTVADITSTATLQKIDTDLIQPARRAGYAKIWLSGISMGALMALAYTDFHAGQVQGLCLLSPYPGNRLLLREIAVAGGLHAWHPHATADVSVDQIAHLTEDLDAEQRLWRCLKNPAGLGNLYLGYGSEDRFVDGLRQITQALPGAAIDIIAGGHDWQTWEKLWCNFLDSVFVGKLDKTIF